MDLIGTADLIKTNFPLKDCLISQQTVSKWPLMKKSGTPTNNNLSTLSYKFAYNYIYK